MARYCFYCGRALVSGEKCNCRTAGSNPAQSTRQSSGSTGAGQAGAADNPVKTGAAAQSGSTGTAAGPGQAAAKPAKSGMFRRFFQAFNPFSSASEPASGRSASHPAGGKVRQQAAKNRQQNQARGARSSAGPKGRSSTASGLKAFLPDLKQLASCLVRPTEGIRQAVQSGSQRSALIILILQSLVGGSFLVVFANQPILRSLLDLSMTPVSQTIQISRGLFIFLQGFGISLAASLLLTLIYQLSLRYLFRKPVGFRQLLSGLSPANLYFLLFMLAAVLALPASFLSALMMLMTGFAVAALAHYLALRQLSGFDDNRCLFLTAFVLMLYTGIVAMMLNLSLPVLQALMNQSGVI